MKKSFRNRVTTAIVSVLILTLLAGCGAKSDQMASDASSATPTTPDATSASETPKEGASPSAETAVDTGKFVTLKMYAIGDQGGPYAADALKNLNAILKEKINAELEPIMVGWGEYKQKFPVVMASGEKYDMMFAANWILFDSEAPKGAYYNLNDLLPKYAPKTYAMHSKEIWDQCSVDGKIFLFPKIGKEYVSNGVLIREDLRVKYDLPEIKTMDDLGTYMDGIKKNEPSMIPYNTQASVNILESWKQMNDFAVEIGGRTSITYKLGDAANIFSYVFTDEYEQLVKRQREWYNKGYWSSSLLSEKTNVNDMFKNGMSAIYIGNIPTVAGLIENATEKGFTSKFYPIEIDTKIEKVLFKQNGYALNVNAENPERSVMMLELLNQDQDAFDAMSYGIKGKTYDLTSDGKFKAPEGVPVADTGLLNLAMGVGNINVVRESANFPAELTAILAEYDKKAVSPDLGGFIFNPDKVSAELAALINVYTQYQLPLNWGVTDPATGLQELRNHMKDAGIDLVLEEVKSQVDAYLASHK